jgi:hypothetical protein
MAAVDELCGVVVERSKGEGTTRRGADGSLKSGGY